MFGSICMAKAPESLIDQIPEKSRFVPAPYMYIKPNSLAHVVTTQISGKEHTSGRGEAARSFYVGRQHMSIGSQQNSEHFKRRATFERIYEATKAIG